MLTAAENDVLTRIGPGTRMGTLMRRYWHPIAAATALKQRWATRVRLLGEDLVLYNDRSGTLGLIGESCPHRRASMAYGIPTQRGIHCPYHGWEFNGTGRCLEMPNEPEGSTFKDKVHLPDYAVRELGGMLWAYLGPQPPPEIPQIDGYRVEGAIRLVGKAVLPCNWLQIMENSLDPVHTEWLHGNLYEFVKEQEHVEVAISRHHRQIRFKEFPYGIYKQRLLDGQSETADDWTVGHPIVFPYTLAVGNAAPHWRNYAYQIRVPMDDENTLHLWYNAYVPPAGAVVPAHLFEKIWSYDVPYLDQNGVGIVAYRKFLLRELAKAERGEDPMGVVRDPGVIIRLPMEQAKFHYTDGFESLARRTRIRYAPIVEDLIGVFQQNPRNAPVPA